MGWANNEKRIDKTGQMVWSKLSIKLLGVHFGNSVLDNSSWDEINGSLGNNCQYIEQSATLFGMKKKKRKKKEKNFKPNPLIQTLVHSSDKYYSDIYQTGIEKAMQNLLWNKNV